MAAQIIEKFTPDLVTAICDCVQSVADKCLSKGLIPGDVRTDILESSAIPRDKTRKLVMAVKNSAEIDSVSVDIFLGILKEELPERSKSKLLTQMKAELTANTCMALLPATSSCLELASMDHLLEVGTTHSSHDISRQIIQEQNPYIGRLEESNREFERVVAEKSLLRKKLQETEERLKVPLTTDGQPSLPVLQSTNDNHQSATVSIFETDILPLKRRIEELEQKSAGLEMTIKRSRSAIDVKVEGIVQKLIVAQKNLEFHDQRFRQLKESLEYKREQQSYNSGEGSDKQATTEDGCNDTKSVDGDSPTKQPLLREIMMEYKNFFGNLAYRFESRWEEVGIQLEVNDSTLQSIRYVNYEKTEERSSDIAFRDMIRVWLKQEKPLPTWLNFVIAMERLKFQEFADHLRSNYCS